MDVTSVDWLHAASKRRRYLVGVSGGADSVALLHLLVRAGFSKLVVCHLNHQLRGQTATGDAAFVAKLADQLGLDAETGSVDVAMQARERGNSMETVGRLARHGFFAECAKKWRCSRLLLGHHADDQAETVLWNLLRGSRVATGMPETQMLRMGNRSMQVVRPLLSVRRDDLRGWLVTEGLCWREDATNAEPIATRNRLRNEVMPLLEQVARRDVVASLNRAAEAGAELKVIQDWAVEAAAVSDPQGRLHVGRLRELPLALRRACIFEFLKSAGIPDLDRAALDQVLGMIESEGPAKVMLKGGRVVRRRQARVWVEP